MSDKCPYCDGTTEEHAADCGTLLPPIEGTINLIEEADDLNKEPQP